MTPHGMALPWIDVAARLVIATVAAGLIGLERERAEMSAGLRTHALVGLGAALLMIASAYGFSDILRTPNVVLDPSRIAAQVVSGVGFLGAGTILVQQQTVRGLTTAASIWAVAAIGLAIGGGLYTSRPWSRPPWPWPCWRSCGRSRGGSPRRGASRSSARPTILQWCRWTSCSGRWRRSACRWATSASRPRPRTAPTAPTSGCSSASIDRRN